MSVCVDCDANHKTLAPTSQFTSLLYTTQSTVHTVHCTQCTVVCTRYTQLDSYTVTQLHSYNYTVTVTQYTVHSTQYTVHHYAVTRYTVHSTQHTAHSTQHTAYSTQHTAHSTDAHTVRRYTVDRGVAGVLSHRLSPQYGQQRTSCSSWMSRKVLAGLLCALHLSVLVLCVPSTCPPLCVFCVHLALFTCIRVHLLCTPPHRSTY